MNLDIKVPTETVFVLLESPYKNVWIQVCGRATPSVPFKIVFDEKLLTIGLLKSEGEYE